MTITQIKSEIEAAEIAECEAYKEMEAAEGPYKAARNKWHTIYTSIEKLKLRLDCLEELENKEQVK